MILDAGNIKELKGISCIYKITSPAGRVYIGQSINMYKRYRTYQLGNFKGQKALYSSVIKYGFDNHVFEIIELHPVDIDASEIYWIEYYKSNKHRYPDCNGLNLSDGGPTNKGRRCIVSDNVREMRRKQALSSNGVATYYKNNPQELIGEKNPFYGKKHTEETRLKMKQNRTNSCGIKHFRSKPVIDTATGFVYENAVECSNLTGINYSTLRSMLNGGKLNNTTLMYTTKDVFIEFKNKQIS